MTARGSSPEHRQSELDITHATSADVVNFTANLASEYFINYPIGAGECFICDDPLPSMNLKIREHITNVHNVHAIKYRCRICRKEYLNISSIKSHYPVSKRSNVNPLPVPAQTLPVKINVTPFRCLECIKSNVNFVGNDNKELVNHMRINHPEEYEKSKTVATKRVTWSADEDQLLATTEIQLKQQQKGQLLESLYCEYNKLAGNANAPKRSKEAIRERRRKLDYKLLLESLARSSDTNLNTNSPDDNKRTPNNVRNSSYLIDMNPSRELIKRCLDDMNASLNNSIRTAAKAILENDYSIGILELSFGGLLEAVSSRNANTPLSQHSRNSVSNTRQRPPRSPRRQEKDKQHGYYQRLFYKNKRKLVTEVLDDAPSNSNPPPINEAEKYYKDIWCKTNEDKSPFTIKCTPNASSIFEPISKNEVLDALKNTNKNSAAGLDKITIRDCYGIIPELVIVFNIWLNIKKIPAELKKNKTVLIPQGNSDLNNLKNCRPITISSVILRIYNKILGKRINNIYRTSDKQVGFKPVNGCGINIAWLHTLLKHARLSKNNLYACLIDVSKAFDSVSHQSIVRTLRRNGAPEELIEIIVDQYTNTTTAVTYDSISSNQIEIKSGVKQGDPLSSVLFNLVIDELFDILKNDYGYGIDGIGQTNARCFADDLYLVSSSRIGMGELLKKTTRFLADRSLVVKPSKCISIGLAKGKKSKIEHESLFNINDAPIPMLGFTNNTAKYLGIRFTSLGAIDFVKTKVLINESLNKIMHLPLKAECKLDLLRTFVIPRFIFQLIHTQVCPSALKKIDITIRRAVRKILHLPISLSNESFYIPLKEGGLQLPVIHEVVGIAKIKLFKKLDLLEDPLLKHLIQYQQNMNDRYIVSLNLGGAFTGVELNNLKENLVKEKRVSFQRKIHGVGHEIFSTCPLTNSWIKGDLRTVKTRTFINGLKLRYNTYETRVTTTRGLDTNKTCRRCHQEQESIMHIIQRCHRTKSIRYSRYHTICRKVSKKLIQQGYQVYAEKSFSDPQNAGHYLRPDIIAIKNRNAPILDVSVVYEISGASFNNAYNWKKDKYQPIAPLIMDEFDCDQSQVHGLIIGARGSFFHKHLPIWYSMGLNSSELKYLALGCMEYSLKILALFNSNLIQTQTS